MMMRNNYSNALRRNPFVTLLTSVDHAGGPGQSSVLRMSLCRTMICTVLYDVGLRRFLEKQRMKEGPSYGRVMEEVFGETKDERILRNRPESAVIGVCAVIENLVLDDEMGILSASAVNQDPIPL